MSDEKKKCPTCFGQALNSPITCYTCDWEWECEEERKKQKEDNDGLNR